MRVLITGSDGSLGAELVKRFMPNGVYMSNKNMEEGKAAIEETIDTCLNLIGPITHVINNYGTNHLSWIGTTLEYDSKILLNNVMPAYWVINQLVKRNQTCRVINVASATYRVPQRCTTLYCASKAAVVQMTKVMARELAPSGWIINAIAPGLIVDTKMAMMVDNQVQKLRGWTRDEMYDYALKLIPMGRPTTKGEVVDAIAKIFELPDYINGTVIDMMGGV